MKHLYVVAVACVLLTCGTAKVRKRQTLTESSDKRVWWQTQTA